MSFDKSSRLKVSGMLAAVIVVVGVTAIISNSTFMSESGVSADVKDIATGDVILMPLEVHQEVMGSLNDYFVTESQEEQDRLIQDVIDDLNNLIS